MLSVDPISYIEQTYNIQLKRASGDEYYGPCIFCGGDDRFRVWRDKGNFYCRPGPGHCGRQGFIDQLTGESLTSEQRRLLALESKQRQMEREQKEQDRRLSALERMAKCTDHLRYHNDMTTDEMAYWLEEGMTIETIRDYWLGFCPSCQTDRDRRPSHTIPVFDRDGSTLINIRHRLLGGEGGDKYRPHVAGLGIQLWGAQVLSKPLDRVVILEGEKKGLIFNQTGFPAVATMGKRSFKKEWSSWLSSASTVVIALDPDAKESALHLGAFLKQSHTVKIADFPVKPDDAIVKYRATADDIESFLNLARPLGKQTCRQ